MRPIPPVCTFSFSSCHTLLSSSNRERCSSLVLLSYISSAFSLSTWEMEKQRNINVKYPNLVVLEFTLLNLLLQAYQYIFLVVVCIRSQILSENCKKVQKNTRTCCLSPNTVSAFCLCAFASSLSPPQTRWCSSPSRYTQGLGPPLIPTARPWWIERFMHCPFRVPLPDTASVLWLVRASRRRDNSSSTRPSFSRSSSASLLRLWSSFSQTSSSRDRVRRAAWASWNRAWLACISERASLSWAFSTTMSPAFWLSSDWISFSCCLRREISPDFWHTWGNKRRSCPSFIVLILN